MKGEQTLFGSGSSGLGILFYGFTILDSGLVLGLFTRFLAMGPVLPVFSVRNFCDSSELPSGLYAEPSES